MSECLVWSVSLASTEKQKSESERRAARKKPKIKKKQFILYQRNKREGETGRNQIDKE
jgi:hypothetical protein